MKPLRVGSADGLWNAIGRISELFSPTVRRSARFLERYCGAIHDKAYLVARDRQAGVTRESALAHARAVTRPNFLRDVIALVGEAYEGQQRPASDFAQRMLQRCLREDDVIMPAASLPRSPRLS